MTLATRPPYGPPMRITCGAFALGFLFACGGSGGGGGDDGIPTGFVPLVGGDWTMPVGQEGYYCVRATVTEDMYVHGFRPIAPNGTHHTALAYDLQGGADRRLP